MSIVAFAEGGKSSATPEVLQDIARRHNITISSPSDQAAYLTVIQAADATVALVDALPDYISPLLAPVPTVGGEPRQYSQPDKSIDTYNVWSHHTSLKATRPTSDLLKDVTCVIKDNMTVAGVPYTCGTFPQIASPKDGKYPIPVIDSTIVKRLLEAGAHIIGTSTCENYSLTPMSYTSANGPVDNPWLKGYNAGGSSSGSACMLGLRRARELGVTGLESLGDLTDVAMGGDQAGSIRLPASYCGVYGLKPTHGLIPYTGIAGLHPMIDYCGPMANNIDDIARMLTALAGYDGLDPRMTPESPLRQNITQYHTELASFTNSNDPTSLGEGLRIGIISESLTSPGTSPDVSRIVSEAATKHFTASGATVEQVSVPMHLLAPAIWTASTRTHMATLTAGTRVPDLLSHTLPHFTPRWPLDQEMFDLMTRANPAVINIIFGEDFLTEKYSSASQAKAHRHVFQLREAYNKALEQYDVLITPTCPTVAPPHPDLRPESQGGSGVMDKMKIAVGSTNNTCPFNASGHPAMSVPCGWARAAGQEGVAGSFGQEGWLPVGMQIVGRRWDEMTVLKAAKAFEAGGGGLGKWPGPV
ncbi:hypothetical protein PMZ80_004308 [Knufia obscura]|uniref:Amidase domain-containing protein n=2 Tax=Knufia TaxID=430999 RepID=A0AAN8EDY4_9EURO|nr:hypothetical protein PMZ80_004308 [Knufia obscura]KAK5949193.1 hypothetical protein OHC33_009734 [Knufia fluminis]